MKKFFKTLQDFMPWYIRPSHLIEIVPEIIKDKSSSKTTIPEQEITKDFKFGLEEVLYGIGVIVFLLIINSSI